MPLDKMSRLPSITESSVRTIVAAKSSDGSFRTCWECYFYGFVDSRPEDKHFCCNCRIEMSEKGFEYKLVSVDFEEWKANTLRKEFQSFTFEEFVDEIRWK